MDRNATELMFSTTTKNRFDVKIEKLKHMFSANYAERKISKMNWFELSENR